MQSGGSPVRTTCAYCGVGCGVLATPDGAGGATIAGDPDHPANHGSLCSKGSALGETLDLTTRLLYPFVDGQQTTWDVALDAASQRLAAIIERHGPDAVAFYLSGQLLTEDYYVANKLMKGFIGSANVDTNSRLCMSSSVAGHKRAFGSDTVPGCYEDLDAADLIVLVGSNAAWCHPVLFQRMVRNAETRGATIVNIDVRRTATSDSATHNLVIAPGQDGALFAGLLVHLADNGRLDLDFIHRHTEGFDVALAAARRIAPSIAATALRTRIPSEEVARFFQRFATTERVVTLYSQGVNQSHQGTDKVNAILNCHLATGRLGHPGMGPFSLTGQPNAMGGREVGGLANQLAAHMGFTSEEIDRVGRFWRAARMATAPGLMAVDMMQAVDEGRIKALWVMGTNPAVSLPQAHAARAALAKLDLLIVSENVARTDTLACGAHIRLPAHAWGEKDGTVTNSERRISRQRKFLEPAGATRPDWWILSEVARRLGHTGFDYAGPHEIFAEHAALSAFENDGRRDFDLSGLTALSAATYDGLAPTQWPVRADGARARLFDDGAFFTSTGRASFVAIAPPALAETPSVDYPLLLNTGRVRDQWHTMTRTGLSPRLGTHVTEPFLHVHPDDAMRAGLEDGGLARVSNARGSATYRVSIAPGQPHGTVFAPIHWTDETASDARTGSLVHPIVDPFSGQPDLKATPVAVAPLIRSRTGFILVRRRVTLPRDAFWAWAAIEGGYAARLETDADTTGLVAALAAHVSPGADVLRYEDRAAGVIRLAYLVDDRLEAALFLSTRRPGSSAPRWTLLSDAWAAERITPGMRRLLLSGRSASGLADEGATICACFGVPQKRILGAITDGAKTAAEIGARLKAGTNCGSCLPELKRMLAESAAPASTANERASLQ